MVNLFKTMILAAALALTGCGGGGDSSSGGANDGVYTGAGTVTISAPGIAPSTGRIAVRFAFSGGKVTAFDGAFSGSASFSGNSYKVTITENVVDSGISCTFNITYTGTVGNGATSGNISGGGPCTGAGGSLTLTFSGPYNATRASAKTLNATISSAALQAIR